MELRPIVVRSAALLRYLSVIDLAQSYPISTYQGSPSTRLIQAPDGSTFQVAQTAQQIFDNPNTQQNVFVSINNLRQAL
ncbi:MAG TPA: hypothetical protein VKX49_32165 [Bryobacteraceae bacterium]|nr:hypothetical protein [Bryobacteraceae bacterium]